MKKLLFVIFPWLLPFCPHAGSYWLFVSGEPTLQFLLLRPYVRYTLSAINMAWANKSASCVKLLLIILLVPLCSFNVRTVLLRWTPQQQLYLDVSLSRLSRLCSINQIGNASLRWFCLHTETRRANRSPRLELRCWFLWGFSTLSDTRTMWGLWNLLWLIILWFHCEQTFHLVTKHN